MYIHTLKNYINETIKFLNSLVVPKSKVEAKINYWKFNKKHEKSPPNVIIIVLDSTSRLNFQRQMPNTVKMLQNLKAVEMLGFTKGL
jgi:Zn-dependent M16 (insulinase) family peptidase